jgi:hypothetical protein
MITNYRKSRKVWMRRRNRGCPNYIIMPIYGHRAVGRLIPNFLILACRVVRFRPRISAAPFFSGDAPAGLGLAISAFQRPDYCEAIAVVTTINEIRTSKSCHHIDHYRKFATLLVNLPTGIARYCRGSISRGAWHSSRNDGQT